MIFVKLINQPDKLFFMNYSLKSTVERDRERQARKHSEETYKKFHVGLATRQKVTQKIN